MNQRKKDIREGAAQYDHRDDAYPQMKSAFADGAEFARQELFERLIDLAEQDAPLTGDELRQLAKEYGL